MLKLNLNLSKYRLWVQLLKGRGTRIFAHENIRKFIGGNLALMFVAVSFMPFRAQAIASGEAEQNVITETETPLTTIKVVQYPLEEMHISQGFSFFHPGIDMAAPYGEVIKPIRAGKVEAAGYSILGYGNTVLINHGNGITSLYAHLSKILVKEGQEVATSTVIGRVGSTGHSSGPHLHLEIRDHERAVNPFSVLPLL